MRIGSDAGDGAELSDAILLTDVIVRGLTPPMS
jgi:hypothetical protein